MADTAARLMTREEAAAYVRLTPAAFDDWRSRKLLPGPLPGTRRWDRRAIDLALDKLSGIAVTPSGASALDEWRRRRAQAPQGH